MSALPLAFLVDEVAHHTNTNPRRAPLRSIERYHLIGALPHGFDLVQVLPVDVEKDHDGAYVVSDPTFGVYGQGASEGAAFDDFAVSLVEYYEIMAGGVNPETQAVVEQLRTYMQPVQR